MFVIRKYHPRGYPEDFWTGTEWHPSGPIMAYASRDQANAARERIEREQPGVRALVWQRTPPSED